MLPEAFKAQKACTRGLKGTAYSIHPRATASSFSRYAHHQSPVVITLMLNSQGGSYLYVYLAHYTLTTTFPERTNIKLT